MHSRNEHSPKWASGKPIEKQVCKFGSNAFEMLMRPHHYAIASGTQVFSEAFAAREDRVKWRWLKLLREVTSRPDCITCTYARPASTYKCLCVQYAFNVSYFYFNLEICYLTVVIQTTLVQYIQDNFVSKSWTDTWNDKKKDAVPGLWTMFFCDMLSVSHKIHVLVKLFVQMMR